MFLKEFSPKNKVRKLWQVYKNAGTVGISMHLRLFLFLILLVLTMLLGVIVILLGTGHFTAGRNEIIKAMEIELSHIRDDISKQFGYLSVYAVELSRGLSESIEKNLQNRGIQVKDLSKHPEVLEDILENEYERLLFSLQKAKSSGVFVILDATVNPHLENAAYSRAGLYLKNMEPNIISSSDPTIQVLHGFPKIARNNSLPLHSQWTMEMDIRDASFFRLPMEQAKRYRLPLTRLYYWSSPLILPGTSEKVMLCSIPLLDSYGNVFGVCGFEISTMLFKLSYMPDNSNHSRIFSMLSPVNDTLLHTSEALFAGGYLALDSGLPGQSLRIKKGPNSLFTYGLEKDVFFIGLHDEVQLYPKGSVFEDQKWAVAIMLPKEDMISQLAAAKLRLTFLCLILFIIGVVLSSIISHRYLQPITEGLNIIKSKNFSRGPLTKIPEIDDLIQFLLVQNKEPSPKLDEGLSETVFQEFVNNTKTLSPAERAVFNLYVQGYTAKEITQLLCLSINTIKTHNKRIYMKLNVSSREDLLKYVNKLKEMGWDFNNQI
ncbi:MAG: helix-turn-helix transcriptional regulator [Peptococcaceae bacterium]|nr:helix-turn-helix transcriptional regulator [Peptococcaceae bacterium]